MQISYRALWLLILALAPVACQRGTSGGERPESDPHEKEAAAFAAKRAQHAKDLAAMDVSQLATELQAESMRGLEPFNSMAYSQAVSRGRDLASGLRVQLKEPNRGSFLGLLALRAVDSTEYHSVPPQFRADVLVDALRTSKLFNAWGLPHLSWEEAAKAVIAEGRSVEPGLTLLLADTRRAPMWGSEEVAESERYGYRVRDYAWAMLRSIRGGEQTAIPVDPAARDSLIAAMSKPK